MTAIIAANEAKQRNEQ